MMLSLKAMLKGVYSSVLDLVCMLTTYFVLPFQSQLVPFVVTQMIVTMKKPVLEALSLDPEPDDPTKSAVHLREC